MPNPVKELLLGRGWAGKTISRSETVEHLNPLIRQHIELNHYYRAAVRDHGDPAVVEALQRVQKTARADVGKLTETIHSCGGTPYNGTDLEEDDFELEGTGTEMLRTLQEKECAFQDTLVHERKNVEHQMRTRGILEALTSNSKERLTLLEDLIERADAAAA